MEQVKKDPFKVKLEDLEVQGDQNNEYLENFLINLGIKPIVAKDFAERVEEIILATVNNNKDLITQDAINQFLDNVLAYDNMEFERFLLALRNTRAKILQDKKEIQGNE